MSTRLTIHAHHQGGMRVTADNGRYGLPMDQPLNPDESAQGLKPPEVLLAALSGCVLNSLAFLLRKAGQPFSGLEVDVKGRRSDEPPAVFTEISMKFRIRGKGLDPAKVRQALQESEEGGCPVWVMLKPGVRISADFFIEGD